MSKSASVDALPWSVAQGRTDAYPFQIRFREFPDGFPRERFAQRLNVFWKMSEPLPDGLASAVELERLHVFEERLAAAVEADGFGVMSLALTGRGERELVFHVPDAQAFVQRLTEMPQELERYPIEIHHHEDAAWEYVDDVLSGVEG